jgi:uncharacterized membrane protein
MWARACRGVLLLGMLLSSIPSPALELGPVTVDTREGSFFGQLRCVVHAPLAIVRAVLTDFEHMPAFVPNLEHSQVLEHHGNVYRIRQRGTVHWGVFSQAFESERRIEWFPDDHLVSEGSSEAFRRVHSDMRLLASAEETTLDYRIEMTPTGWLPAFLGARFMRHELAEQFIALGREMERRAQLQARH